MDTRADLSWPMPVDSVVLDLDGTLVDTVYLHTLAWQRAFAAHDLTFPAWFIHRQIGMGGDRLVTAVAGDDIERRLVDRIRSTWEAFYDDLLPEVTALEGAVELLSALEERDLKVTLASSGIPRHTEHALKILGAERFVDSATTSEDADRSKPDPQLLEVALEKVGGGAAVLVGDSVWDVEAGEKAGLPTICLLTGGFGRDELLRAGAVEVCVDAAHLQRRLAVLMRSADRSRR